MNGSARSRAAGKRRFGLIGEWASSTGQVRIGLICALFLGCTLVLMFRLFTFQVLDTEHYQQLANDERHAEIPIKPIRGALLDTNGSPLAVSVRYDSVYVLGTLVGGADKADKLAARLSPVVDVQIGRASGRGRWRSRGSPVHLKK